MVCIDLFTVSFSADRDLLRTCTLCGLPGTISKVWRVNGTGAPVKQVKDKHQPMTHHRVCKRLLKSKHVLKLR